MRKVIRNVLGLEFVELSAEGPDRTDPGAAAAALFTDFAAVLESDGLSLADTVRSRLFGRDRAARDAASDVRRDMLSGPARAATSSYIAPALFASDASVAMDLIALRPGPGLEKAVRENDPPRLPCRYLTRGPLVVFSGQTAVLPSLDVQLRTDILPRITDYLAECGCGWDQVVHMSCYLHASQSADDLRTLIRETTGRLPQELAIHFVEGYSAEGKLVEVEVTAYRNT
jgi:enamine deaminase RidA (YjgF/YER057c/UK114 family)